MRRSVQATGFVIIVVLLVVAFNEIHVVTSYFEEDSPLVGPYVDEVIYRYYRYQDDSVLALLAGDVEIIDGDINPIFLPTLNADPDISIHNTWRNGYGHLTINCAKYPLNISGFRRAFAFAFNKTKVSHEILDGFSIEHDSLVPQSNGWCIEDDFDWNYYTAQPDIGNQILDDLGFEINETSGYRLAPNGTSFEIAIEVASPSSSYGTADIGVEALNSLHIEAHKQAADFNELFSRLDSHGDFDMAFYTESFYNNNVDWLAYEYWSDYANTPYQNPTNFVNFTYDGWRDQLLYGTTYEDVYEAAAEMQKILQYNVPRLVVYVNEYYQAFRNDVFSGHVDDLNGISGQWTTRNIHKLNDTIGGSVTIAIGYTFESFNIFFANTHYDRLIQDNLWPSLYKYGPDLTPWPDLAESMIAETHSDNAAVPDGHTRFTIDIIQNATWTDGTPLTAEDVAFSYTYAYESNPYGNPAGTDLDDLVAVYAPSPYRVVIEFNTESYWHFSTFAFDYAIPYHIFNDDTGIGYDGWDTWNPVYNPSDPHINCGPFIFLEYDNDNYYTIQRNPLFHYEAITDPVEPTSSITTTSTTIITPITSTPSTTTTTTTSETSTSSGTGQIPREGVSLSLAVSTVIGSVSTVVILYCLFHIMRTRRNIENI